MCFLTLKLKKGPETKKHIPNYCIVQYFNGDNREFFNINEFCKWVFNKKQHKNHTFIAHYGKGYNFQFVAD